jgi:hypothetical protein
MFLLVIGSLFLCQLMDAGERGRGGGKCFGVSLICVPVSLSVHFS